MSAPLRPTGEDRDGRRRRGAAPVAGAADLSRKRRLAALAVLAALVVLAAVLVIVKLAGSAHHSASPARHPATSAAPASGAAATPSAAAGGTASAGTGAGALPAFGLVGGGGAAARPAAGKLAVKGSAGDVLFAEDGTALDAGARQVVSAAAREIRQHQPAVVTVTGYTDAVGSAAANDRLSLARARAVARALRADLHGTSARFRAQARGQGKPAAANSAAAGRQLNRRVVIALG
jgi:type VI secretion system protein ImpK